MRDKHSITVTPRVTSKRLSNKTWACQAEYADWLGEWSGLYDLGQEACLDGDSCRPADMCEMSETVLGRPVARPSNVKEPLVK